MMGPWHWFRRKLLSLSRPILEWVGKLHFPFTHKKVTGKHYYDLYPHLKPGMVFITRIRGEISNYLIPGFYTHAAIYYGEDERGIEVVLEAVGEGVIKKDLISFLTSKDYVVALEPKSIQGPDIMVAARNEALRQVGLPYDFQFEYSPSHQEAFYCSELVWYSYESACRENSVPPLIKPQISLGVPTVTPGDFLEKSGFKVVWDSKGVA